MDGGRKKWLDEERPRPRPSPPGPTDYTARRGSALRALRDFGETDSARGPAALVDVRSPEEYSGELLAPRHLPQEGAQRGGHVPGAANIPWATAVKRTAPSSAPRTCSAPLRRQGRHPGQATIAYCRIGERSAHTWFVLTELLGHPNVRNYDGSWTEWGSLIGAPIER